MQIIFTGEINCGCFRHKAGSLICVDEPHGHDVVWKFVSKKTKDNRLIKTKAKR